jgi:hypothetical protein
MKAEGLGASEIAKALKIGRASVYRVLGEGRVSGPVRGLLPIGRCGMASVGRLTVPVPPRGTANENRAAEAARLYRSSV